MRKSLFTCVVYTNSNDIPWPIVGCILTTKTKCSALGIPHSSQLESGFQLGWSWVSFGHPLRSNYSLGWKYRLARALRRLHSTDCHFWHYLAPASEHFMNPRPCCCTFSRQYAQAGIHISKIPQYAPSENHQVYVPRSNLAQQSPPFSKFSSSSSSSSRSFAASLGDPASSWSAITAWELAKLETLSTADLSTRPPGTRRPRASLASYKNKTRGRKTKVNEHKKRFVTRHCADWEGSILIVLLQLVFTVTSTCGLGPASGRRYAARDSKKPHAAYHPTQEQIS